MRKKRRVSFNVLFRFKNVEGSLKDATIPRKSIRSTLKMDGCLGDSGASEDDEDASQSLQQTSPFHQLLFWCVIEWMESRK